MTFNINDIQHNGTRSSVVMLSVVKLSVVMLTMSVVMLTMSVVKLTVAMKLSFCGMSLCCVSLC
jgi:hypothetical protein